MVKDCLALVAFREKASYTEFLSAIEEKEKEEHVQDKDKIPILLSGDLSYRLA